ncbi:MAG: efflux RND transporter periplasmic adaptor subunit [Desulfobacteraceae bacterium]|nr:MAG: efflux RND transporter periplasmic adaptor subunit [Desulfobacteraceae bacterium]
MKKRIILITIIIGVLAAVGLFLVRGIFSDTSENSPPVNQKKPPGVRVASASKATVSRALELTGSVEPYRVAQLASPAEGPVLNIRVREGDRVKAGDALLSIGRKKGIDALIASLREDLKNEEDNLGRTRQLVASEALPGEQLDQARAAFEKVRAQLVKAEETALDYGVIAPWSGVVSRVLVKEGEFVAPRAALLEMYDPASLVIRAAVPEKHAAEIAAGMHVELRLDAFPDEIMQGRIERVYPYLDTRLRTRTIEIIPAKPVHLLPGMFARLKVLLKTMHEAVVVPSEALVSTPKGRVVFVMEDGKAFARHVETGIEEGNRIQIVSGVQPGDKVIVAGNEKLKDGAAVSLAGGEKPGQAKPQNRAAAPAGPQGKVEGGRP